MSENPNVIRPGGHRRRRNELPHRVDLVGNAGCRKSCGIVEGRNWGAQVLFAYACNSFGLRIRIIHEPSDDNPNPAYTAIRRYKSEELELLELLAADAWSRVVEAKDYLDVDGN